MQDTLKKWRRDFSKLITFLQENTTVFQCFYFKIQCVTCRFLVVICEIYKQFCNAIIDTKMQYIWIMHHLENSGLSILQNIFFCVRHKKWTLNELIFGWTIPLKNILSDDALLKIKVSICFFFAAMKSQRCFQWFFS